MLTDREWKLKYTPEDGDLVRVFVDIADAASDPPGHAGADAAPAAPEPRGMVVGTDERKRPDLETPLTPEMWTIIGVGVALSGIGTGGFTLLWRYIAAAERRAEERDARIEKRAEARAAAIEKRAEARDLELKAEIAALRTELNTKVGAVRTELKTEVGALRNDLNTEIGAVRTELKTEIGAVRTELKTEIGAVRTELKVDVMAAKNELKADFTAVKNELRADLQTIVERMERNHTDLRHAIDTVVLNDQARRLAVLEEAVLRTGASPEDREAEH